MKRLALTGAVAALGLVACEQRPADTRAQRAATDTERTRVHVTAPTAAEPTDNFPYAFHRTMRLEGGYVNDPNDHGGETYRGVTRRNWPQWAGWAIVDSAKQVLGLTSTLGARQSTRATLDSILAPDTSLQRMVGEFYRVNYWNPLCLDAEPSRDIAAKLFDVAVNSGVGFARQVRRAVRRAMDSVEAREPPLGNQRDSVGRLPHADAQCVAAAA